LRAGRRLSHSNSGEVRTSIEISALLIAISGHVSRFVSRLFGIEEEAAALAAATADQEPVFRFKVDFVRRRVLPNRNKIQASVAPDAISNIGRRRFAIAPGGLGRIGFPCRP
jgi:hypothetical protein